MIRTQIESRQPRPVDGSQVNLQANGISVAQTRSASKYIFVLLSGSSRYSVTAAEETTGRVGQSPETNHEFLRESGVCLCNERVVECVSTPTVTPWGLAAQSLVFDEFCHSVPTAVTGASRSILHPSKPVGSVSRSPREVCLAASRV
jgi:hypothetical protein